MSFGNMLGKRSKKKALVKTLQLKNMTNLRRNHTKLDQKLASTEKYMSAKKY